MRLYWTLLLLEVVLFLLWHLSHLEGFQWGSDEGIYLMRVRLLQQGYRLYRDVWTDQLPGLIELLRGAFAVFGTQVAVGRAVIVLLTATGMIGMAVLVQQTLGRAAALAMIPLLSLLPNSFWLSRAIISPDLPSTSLGVAGLAAAAIYIKSRQRLLLLVSGVLFSVALYVKATALFIVIPAGLWLVSDSLREGRGSHRSTVCEVLDQLIPWGAALLLPFVLALTWYDLPSLWQQFVGTQVASGQMDLKVGEHAGKALRYLRQDNWGLVTLALAGILIARGKYRTPLLLGLSWLLVCIIFLLLRSPLWPSHHLVVLLYPLAYLAAIGLADLWERLGRRNLDWRAAVVGSALAAYAASAPGLLTADQALLAAPTYQSSLDAVAFLKERFPQGGVAVADYQMIPFQAGLSVPPSLATVTKKRIQLGMLSAESLIAISEQERPDAIVFWDEQLSRAEDYVSWVRAHYLLGYKHNYHEIYVARPREGIQYPSDAVLGSLIEFRGYATDRVMLDPGGDLRVTLYWEALAPVGEPLYGFVHLLSADGTRLAQKDHLAWGEQYPSTLWQVGETVADVYQLDIPLDTESGVYTLSAGLYHGQSKRRLEAVDGEGHSLAGAQLSLGSRVLVRWPASYEAVPVDRALDLRFEQVTELKGYTVEAAEGGAIAVSLLWRALTPPERPSYKVFVHLRDDGRIVSQHDGFPGQASRPTAGWRPGEYVLDAHTVSLEGVDPGEYELYVGLYDPITLVRVKVSSPGGDELPSAEALLESYLVTSE